MAAPTRAVVKVPPPNEFEICRERSSFSQLDEWAENIEVTAFPLATLIESNALPPQVDFPGSSGNRNGIGFQPCLMLGMRRLLQRLVPGGCDMRQHVQLAARFLFRGAEPV